MSPTTITRQQALRRWETLPETIKDALVSENTFQVMEKVFSDFHIPGEKQEVVSRITGHVLMGFIHPEDAAKEIQDATGMNSQHARELADSINVKIFSPFRDALESIYALPEAAEPIAPVRPSFDSIIAPKAAPASPAGAGPKPLDAISTEPDTPAPAAAATPAPAPAKPVFTAPPASFPAVSAIPAKSAEAPTPSPLPAAPKPAAAPAPFIIQAETKVQPVVQAPKFTMESLGKASSAFASKPPASAPMPKIAQVEIGNLPERTPSPSGIVGKYESAPRAIHYGGPSTPIPGISAAPAGGPAPFGSIQGMAQRPGSVPASPAPRVATPPPSIPSYPPAAPAKASPAPSAPKPGTIPAPIPSGAGAFIKTMITPKDEGVSSVPPTPSAK